MTNSIFDPEFNNYEWKVQNGLAVQFGWNKNPPSLTKIITEQVRITTGPFDPRVLNFKNGYITATYHSDSGIKIIYSYSLEVPDLRYDINNITIALINYNIWQENRKLINLEKSKRISEKQKLIHQRKKEELEKSETKKAIDQLEKIGYKIEPPK